MNNANVEIALAALLPALLLCRYVYLKDKKEKEPIGMLVILFVVGAVAFIPAFFAQNGMITLVRQILSPYISFSAKGMAEYVSPVAEVMHGVLDAFAGTALIEEGFKWLALFLLTRRSKAFNCLFDGIIYSVFIAIGFATSENVYYALIGGWDTLFMRAISSLPGHIFFGVTMGYCYTMWHSCYLAKKAERYFELNEQITPKKRFSSGEWFTLSLILPIFIHGLYSFTGHYETSAMTAIFYILIGALYVLSFSSIRRLSAADTEKHKIVTDMLVKKYPELDNKVQDYFNEGAVK